ncbi:MAG: cyclase family protein [Nitrospirota bacterium]|nr:MAG: cyclase family protein [Nitrospirota bacterium]
MFRPNKTIIFDLTLPISPTTLTYPGDPPPTITRTMDLSQGDSLTASHLSLNCHVGTHVDAPAHFINNGATLEELPMECFYGPAVVINLEGKEVIEVSDLVPYDLPLSHHILLKTDNSRLLQHDQFSESFCVVSPDTARYLLSKRPHSIGFDYYSLDPHQPTGTFQSHRILAQSNIPVFVCLDLSEVHPDQYYFWGFPLRLEKIEASPVRAVLMKEM